MGSTVCENGPSNVPCVPVGYMQHWGRAGNALGAALPMTLNGEVSGVLGGFGWHLMFNAGAPLSLKLSSIQARSCHKQTIATRLCMRLCVHVHTP